MGTNENWRAYLATLSTEDREIAIKNREQKKKNKNLKVTTSADEANELANQTLNNGEEISQNTVDTYRIYDRYSRILHNKRDDFRLSKKIEDLDLDQETYDGVIACMNVETFLEYKTEITNILVEGLRYAKRTINTKADEAVREIIFKQLYDAAFILNFMHRKFLPNNWLRILLEYKEHMKQDFIIMCILEIFLNLMNHPEDKEIIEKNLKKEPRSHRAREILRIMDAQEKKDEKQLQRCEKRLQMMDEIIAFYSE